MPSIAENADTAPEPTTTPTDLDTWTVLSDAMRAGLPLPFVVNVGSSGHQASPFGIVALSVRERAEVDTWAVWAGEMPAVRRFDDIYLYGVWVPGWRGWHALEVHCHVEESDLTDVERKVLGGGER